MINLFGNRYFIAFLISSFLLNTFIVKTILALRVGNLRLYFAIEDAFEYFTFVGYIFLSFFRMGSYFIPLIVMSFMNTEKSKNSIPFIFIVSLISNISMTFYGYWTSLKPFYTEQHVSSTTAISIFFTSIVAGFVCGFSSILAMFTYRLIKYLRQKQF